MMKYLDVHSIFQNGCDVDKLTKELQLYSKVKAQDTEKMKCQWVQSIAI